MTTWRAVQDSEQSDSDENAQKPFGHFAPNAVQKLLIGLGRNSILRRGVFRGPFTRLILALGRGPVDIKFRKAAFRIRGENNLIEYGLLLNPDYNKFDIEFLLQDAAPDANFVDIGSNIGLYALPLAAHAPQGKTLAIDANPKMISRLAWNAKAGNNDNVMVVHTAVSDQDGMADLVIRKNDVAIVAIKENSDGTMPVKRLAAVIADAGLTNIHGLKIDIEGHEDKALVPFLDAASPKLLPKRIVIEHPGSDIDYPGCAAAFKRHGYRLTGRSRNNSFYVLEVPLD